MSKFLIISGIILLVIGLALRFNGKLPFFGKLPGDILIERQNFTLYFPLATSIIVSLLLSLIIFLVNKGKQ